MWRQPVPGVLPPRSAGTPTVMEGAAAPGAVAGGRVSFGMNVNLDRAFASLGDHDPIVVLKSTPMRIEMLLESLGSYRMEQPYAPGKWKARDILAHLADTELAMGFRIRQVVAGAAIQPFDQDVWAQRYGKLEPSLAVETFRALRGWNLALLATFDLDDWLSEGLHPERGVESVDVMVRYLAGHDLHHLEQLERIAAGST